MKHNESSLQISCVSWFRLQYPKYANLLFAIPNGGKRSVITATILKREGALAGVADLMLAVPKSYKGNSEYDFLYTFCGLFIEMKYLKGKQSDSQKSFQKSVEEQGYRYEVICDFDSFKSIIEEYLN